MPPFISPHLELYKRTSWMFLGHPPSTALGCNLSVFIFVMTVLAKERLLHQRNVLLEEEQLLAARLCSLRSRLNDMALISSLPPEVMEEIFRYCVACLYDTQPLVSPLAWTQICRQWRLISLNSTRLWQCIDLCNARFAKEFLLRCKQAPLSIVSTSLLKYHFDSMTINSNQLHSIDIFLFHADMVHLFSCIKGQLGSLTRLSLKVPAPKPLVLQDVSFPKVQHLALDGVVIDWEQFHNLIRLTIRGLDSEHLPSIISLQRMLRRSPDLLSLRLENYLPAPQSQPYESYSVNKLSTLSNSRSEIDQMTPIIQLLQLRDLVICTSSSVASALFGVLCLGLSTKIQLFCSLDAKEDLHTIFPNGLPYTSSTLVHPSSTSHHGLVRRIRLSRSGIALIAHHSSNNSIDAWADPVPTNGDKTPQKQRFPFSSLNASTSTTLAISSASSSISSPLASRLCTSLPTLLKQHPHNHTFYTMLQITHLELNTGVLLDLPMPVLEDFFSEMPILEGLAVGFNDLTSLLAVLGATTRASSCLQTIASTGILIPLQPSIPLVVAHSTIPVPKLKRLTFSRPADLWWNFADRWLSLILTCLEARLAMGAGLDKVEFYRCHGVCDDPSNSTLGWTAGLTSMNLEMVGRVKEIVREVIIA